MQSKTFKVTCANCKASRVVTIISSKGRELIDWHDNHPDPKVAKILSGRKRLDNHWGWSCICGNDDIMTKQEKSYLTNHQSPSPLELAVLIKELVPQKPKFRMVGA